MVTAPNVTEMRENIEINIIFLHTTEEGKCVNISKILKSFLKQITQTLFLIYSHVPVHERGDLR